MRTPILEYDEDLVSALRQTHRPIQQSAREMIVMELYRRRIISSGKAAGLLSMNRFDFIRWASDSGIAFFDLEEQDLQDELGRMETS